MAGWSWRLRRENGEALRGGQGSPGARWGQSPGGGLRLPVVWAGAGRVSLTLGSLQVRLAQGHCPRACCLGAGSAGLPMSSALGSGSPHEAVGGWWISRASVGALQAAAAGSTQEGPGPGPGPAPVKTYLSFSALCLALTLRPGRSTESVSRGLQGTRSAGAQGLGCGWECPQGAGSHEQLSFCTWEMGSRRSSTRGPQMQGLSGTTPGPVFPGKAVGAQ